jgi:hypothetical protein
MDEHDPRFDPALEDDLLPADWHSFAKSLVVAVLLGLAAACVATFASSVKAEGLEPYFTAGIGRGELRHPGPNKWWIQEGFDYTIHQKSTVYQLGIGLKVKPWLAAEVLYHDLGQYNHFAGFIAEEDLYNPSEPDFCTGECPATQWGYLRGEARAISLSLLPRYAFTKNFSVFGRLGVAYYKARFDAYITDGIVNSRHVVRNFAGSGEGYSPLYGLGMTYGKFTVETAQFGEVAANGSSPYKDASTVTVSYRWGL